MNHIHPEVIAFMKKNDIRYQVDENTNQLLLGMSKTKNALVVKEDLLDLKNELKNEIYNLRSELRTGFTTLKFELLQWIMPCFVSIMIALMIAICFK